MAKIIQVADSNIDLESADLKKAKNLKAVKKLKIFSHLDEDAENAAELEVASQLGIANAKDDEKTETA